MTVLRPFTIKTQCVASDDELYANISHALTLGLPVLGQHISHDVVAVMVGSGPSVKGQLEAIKQHRENGSPIIAVKDAHDWLIENGVIPDYAIAVDPQEHRWNCFGHKHNDVKYFIASQCHASMFEHLRDMQVFLWHLYIRKGQSVPPHGTALIAGGTTTGLRAITLMYTMGFRRFELFGYDSCLSDGGLRVNGDKPSKDDAVNEIVVDGKYFKCNPAMTAQASEFQNLYVTMPDIEVNSNGDGLITTIIEARNKQPKNMVSFIHNGGMDMASYRYRAAIPAAFLEGCSINGLNARTLIFSKPQPHELDLMKFSKVAGKRLIVDFCDDHFANYPHYAEMLKLADEIVCPTTFFAEKLRSAYGRNVTVIDDPYEFPEESPHCNGTNLLWYGHASNYDSLTRVIDVMRDYQYQIVSNAGGDWPWDEWSSEGMFSAFAKADIVVMPASAPYKSCNRTTEAVRQGCFVVAEPHPSLEGFPGIWIGDIKEGIEWARQNPLEAKERTRMAQQFVTERFSPRTVACAWSQVIVGLPSILEAVSANGTDG